MNPTLDRTPVPTLARLSFWVPSERLAEFKIAYEEKVASVLKRHGLVASSERGRSTVEGVFSRIFEVETLAEVAEKEMRLRADPAWQGVLQILTKAFHTDGSDGLIRYRLGVYVTPAGPGKVVPAGHGRGHWRTYDRVDGLADNWVRSGYQDREGNLWFGTESGVSRYDGHHWTTFTAKDGLGDNRVQAILQDREGHLWFGTWGGVSRYDGKIFQTLTRQDGLPSNSVWSIFQDRDGDIWIGTTDGVTRYRPPASAPPLMFMDGVVADRRYKGEATLEVSSWVRLIAFEFHGTSLKTRLEAIVYQYRLEGYDEDWKTTRERRVEYWDLPPGAYTFQVRAFDRDLVSSDTVSVRLTVVLDQRIQALTEALSGGRRSSEFVGNSEALRRVQVQLLEVARTDMTVLILGETGTGKGIAARAVHGLSKRRAGPLIQVNCGAIPEGLVESELFGHERGAFRPLGSGHIPGL